MTNISLSIIIVNYNTFKLTRDTINSCISEPTRYTYEIFLVDNKSTDDSLFQLKKYFESEISRGLIKVIENDENKTSHYRMYARCCHSFVGAAC